MANRINFCKDIVNQCYATIKNAFCIKTMENSNNNQRSVISLIMRLKAKIFTISCWKKEFALISVREKLFTTRKRPIKVAETIKDSMSGKKIETKKLKNYSQ